MIFLVFAAFLQTYSGLLGQKMSTCPTECHLSQKNHVNYVSNKIVKLMQRYHIIKMRTCYTKCGQIAA